MNIETIDKLLEHHLGTIDRIILSRQDPVTGLLPASTAVNAHGDYTDAWVRDNVYSILCVWGLALGYRKHAPEHVQAYLLSQSVVKLMRGLLNAMMRQSDRVESFKNSLDPINALHAKYGTHTGLAVVGDDEWGHLQLDATSLFLLMMTQMISSGLRIVYTLDEVSFIQNLVHYISRTYCTPDYGIWERGNKINHGTAEINCSSVGMAKAALEALNGFSLFGEVNAQEAIIHVVPSDIARSRFTLQGLLPRESMSKETDAALLSIIGFPAYAVEDEQLVIRTREKIIKKLAGRYGCKRFLLDGHQSVLEDTSRLHYEPSELRAFEHIESEWPLFFTYLLLDAQMREDDEAARHWREKLEPLFIEYDGVRLLPELYSVPEDAVDAEKADPGSQQRVPNENVPLVWAQSLFMLSDMLRDGVLEPSDIDPRNRRQRIGHHGRTDLLVPLLAENGSVKQRLAEMGYATETIEDVAPIRVMHASELSKVHGLLGNNEKLGLSGRPPVVTRTITSARRHLLAGEEVVFLPYYFDPQSFYLGYDCQLLVEHFLASIRFLSNHWDQPGQPLLLFLVREEMLASAEQRGVFGLLDLIRQGRFEGATLHTGPLAALVRSASTERIDNLFNHRMCDLLHQEDAPIPVRLHSGYTVSERFTSDEIRHLETLDDARLSHILKDDLQLRKRVHALRILWGRHGGDFRLVHEETLSTAAEHLYSYAAREREWGALRRIADITRKFDDRLEDVLLDVLIRQKRLAVGRAYSEEATLSKPLENHPILETVYAFCGNNAAENALTQEVVLHLGHLIRTQPEMFDNLLTLRTWYFVQLLVGQISRELGLTLAEAYEQLLELSPGEIYRRLQGILHSFANEVTRFASQENLHATGILTQAAISAPAIVQPSDISDWRAWREQAGLIGHLPARFYKDVWYLLQQCRGMVIGDKYSVQNRLGSEETHDATAGEQSFELKIDTLLHEIEAPEYRQLNIELIQCLSALLRENPDLHIDDDLILDVIIGYAVRIAWNEHHATAYYDEHRSQAWQRFYTLSPKQTGKAFSQALNHLLDAAKEDL